LLKVNNNRAYRATYSLVINLMQDSGNNRLGGKIAFYPMPLWKSYEINDYETLEICECFMMSKILNRNKENPCRNIQ